MSGKVRNFPSDPESIRNNPGDSGRLESWAVNDGDGDGARASTHEKERGVRVDVQKGRGAHPGHVRVLDRSGCGRSRRKRAPAGGGRGEDGEDDCVNSGLPASITSTGRSGTARSSSLTARLDLNRPEAAAIRRRWRGARAGELVARVRASCHGRMGGVVAGVWRAVGWCGSAASQFGGGVPLPG